MTSTSAAPGPSITKFNAETTLREIMRSDCAVLRARAARGELQVYVERDELHGVHSTYHKSNRTTRNPGDASPSPPRKRETSS